MHEVGLMQTALELAFTHARQAGASRIHQMTLRVGTLSGVVPDALRMAFDASTPGTVADGATLVVDEVAVRCRCEQCDEEFWPEDVIYLCSNCGTLNSRIEEGRAVFVHELHQREQDDAARLAKARMHRERRHLGNLAGFLAHVLEVEDGL